MVGVAVSTIPELFEAAVAEAADSVWLRTDAGQWTYGEARGRIVAAASALAQRGAGRGEIVLATTRNTPDHLFMWLRGRLPDAGETTMLDAVLVSLADHGLTPTVIAARMTHTGAPESLQGAVAAGLLGAGDVFLGVVENTARFLGDVLQGVGDAQADEDALRAAGGRNPLSDVAACGDGKGETLQRSAMRLPRWPTPNVASIPATTKASVRSVPSSSESPVSM